MKVVFRYSESTSGPIIKRQWPLQFDLIDDPVEAWDLSRTASAGGQCLKVGAEVRVIGMPDIHYIEGERLSSVLMSKNSVNFRLRASR